MKIVLIAFRNIGRNTRRTILSAAAIAVATLVTVFMFALIEGLKADMVGIIQRMVSGQVRVRTSAFDANEIRNPLHLGVSDAATVLQALQADPTVKALSPRISFPTALYREGKIFKGMGMGLDFPREEGFQDFSRFMTGGRLPAMGARETVLSSGLARDMGVGTGDSITLFTRNATGGMNGMTLRISGIVSFSVSAFDQSFFFAPLDTVQRLLGMPGSVTEILVILRDGVDPDTEASALAGVLRDRGRGELAVTPWTRIGIWPTYLRIAEAMFTVIALGFLLIGATVVINTTMMVIYERTREIGTMSALGMTSGQIVRLFFLESLLVAGLGSLAGTLAGIAITLPLSVHGIDYTEMMEGVKMAIPSVYYPVLNWKSTALAFLYSAAVSSIVSIIPSRRASRVEPVTALRAI
jgi:putative ABC transport system permease protein